MALVPRVTKRHKWEIERDARQLLKKHFPERLKQPGKVNVLEFWELLEDCYGLKPGVAELSDGVEGMTWPDGRVLVSEETYRAATQHQGRARFTMLHEAYHGLRHREQIRNVLMDTGELALYRRSDIDTLSDPEWQSNTFAAALLMPAEMVRLVWKDSHGKIEDMMWMFGVSWTAAKVRLASLQKSGQLICNTDWPPFVLNCDR